MALPMPDDFMQMLKNPKQVAKMLLKDMGTCETNSKTLETLLGHYSDGKTPDPKQVAVALTQSLKHCNDVNRRIMMMLLGYVLQGDFTVDAAKVLSRLGHGQEALQEMLKQKLG